MTFKELTKEIALNEGLKKNTDIGQINEITKITLKILCGLRTDELVELLSKVM